MMCPECGGRLYDYYPSDGGPESPKRECDHCGWWQPLGPADDEEWGLDSGQQALERGPR